mgnify:CR=1 FL=1
MAYRFKKQIFGFMDLLRFKKMVAKRREKLETAPATPLPSTYTVNETAKILHPGKQDVKLAEVITETADTKTYVFALSKKMIFRAGQYITVTAKVGESEVTRPYAISSSPLAALREGKLSVTVKKAGFFSDWLFDNAKVGDTFTLGDPSGNFYYEALKDSKNIVAIAGGSGITPFYSMAQALKEGNENFNMTLIYGAKTRKDIIFRDALEDLQSDNFKIVYVLSDEKVRGYESGFITKDIIQKYAPEQYTAMLCGPQAMYSFVDKELDALGVKGKFVKHEANCIGNRDVAPKNYKITVHIQDETYEIKAKAEETVLVALERAGLKVPSKCRAGGCGFCHSKLVKGKFAIAGADKRRLADEKFGYFHPCCSYPDSNMEIIVPKG